jgi:hypothetical protein
VLEGRTGTGDDGATTACLTFAFAFAFAFGLAAKASPAGRIRLVVAAAARNRKPRRLGGSCRSNMAGGRVLFSKLVCGECTSMADKASPKKHIEIFI